jgi:hypothetical protein
MRQLFAVAALAALALVLSCDHVTEPGPVSPGAASAAISDAIHGDNRTPGFFWLAPMVAQPPRSAFGTFEPGFRPTIRLVCLSTTAAGVDCDPAEVLAEFGMGTGMAVDPAGSYQVDLDTRSVDLRTSTADDITTYRVIALTDPLTELGGPFVLGYADLVLAATGNAVKNLATDDVIALLNGRVLPVRFRIDRGAYEHVLRAAQASLPGDPDGALCQENCSVTVVSATEPTQASLEDEATGESTTGVHFEAGDVAVPTILVIDELVTADEGEENCATGVTVDKKYCYRYKVFPDVPFNNPVRFGICPRDLPIGPGSIWRILKVDRDGQGNPTLTRPEPVDVSDFLPCTGLGGLAAAPSGGLLRLAFDWLVPRLFAREVKVWGGMAEDFSDVFWGVDALLTMSPTDAVLPEGATRPMVVLARTTVDDAPASLAGAGVLFTITSGAGSLSAPDSVTPVSQVMDGGRVVAMTLLTGTNGAASVNWTVALGANVLEATWADLPTAEGLPLVFAVTGLPGPEGMIAGSWRTWWQATSNPTGAPGAWLSVASFQHSTSAANFGMVKYSAIPRVATSNAPSADPIELDAYRTLERPYEWLYQAIEESSLGLKAILDGDVDLGAGEARAVAFARFVQGISYGYLAMLYHQGPIIDETTGPGTPAFVGYAALGEAAMGYLDQAIAAATAGSFVVPSTWMFVEEPGLDAARLATVARSFKARIRAGMARSPAERAAVNWAQVLADAQSGITTDLNYAFDRFEHRFNGALYYTLAETWSQLNYFVHGMADQSGAYQSWMALPVADRHPYLDGQVPVAIVTPDTRFPRGATLALQRQSPGTRFIATPEHLVATHWFRPERGTWRWSFYRDARSAEATAWNGVSPDITMHEMRLLAAEAHYRTGNLAAAVALINVTRSAAGLSPTDASGTNVDCVPRLPDGQCGGLFEMLKWEKRLMAGHNNGSFNAGWYFDSRGWGDLMEGTILHLPVPYTVATEHGLPVMNFGGVGQPGGAPVGTYGY